MYGWIVDGISSLFEPVTGQNPTEWPGKGNVSEGVPTRPGEAGAQRQENHSRPAKRNYQSVDVADGVCQSDQVEVKRRRRDIVISFVKKTVAGVAGLLRLRNPMTSRSEKPRHYEDSQPVTLMGIDELHTSWLNSNEWKMNKPVGGVNERSGKTPFQSSSPPLIRKYRQVTVQLPSLSHAAGLSAGLPDRGKDREIRGSLQLLPSRPALRVGTTNPDLTCNGFGHNRCYKPSLTVEEAIKQNNKEHYRRLLEMVTEKYSKSQPLPFNQTKPQDELLSQIDHKIAASGKVFESVPRKTAYTAAPSVFTLRNTSATKDRWGSLTFSKTFSGAFEESQSVRCTKQKQAADVDLSTEVATRLNLVDRETPAVSLPDTHSSYTRHSDEDIPRLTKEMAAEVSCALAQSDPNLVLSAAFKLRITQRDLATLQEGGWLNDEDDDDEDRTLSGIEEPAPISTEVENEKDAEEPATSANQYNNMSAKELYRVHLQRQIAKADLKMEYLKLKIEVMNFYLSLVMERCSEVAGLKMYSFSTFFFPKLRGGGGGQAGGHAAVKRWTKAVDLFLYDLILVPLHLGVHWAMAVIDFRSKTVKSYDSMGQRHDDICSLLLLYLKEEHKTKKGRELDSPKWTIGSLKATEIPQQKNGSDCGVFACKYADYIVKGRPLTFKQCHMPLFRKLMIWEILNQKLL